MKVVHLNTNDIIGGAARAAYNLHCGLRQLGHDSSMFVEHRHSNDPTVTAFKPPMDLPSRIRRRLRRKQITRRFACYRTSRPDGYEQFSDDRTQHGASLLDQLPSCDVINLHWIAGFVDYLAFFTTVPQHTPVVWTLHDMNAFTGGCHYDVGCGRYMSRCGACPQLGSSEEDDLSYQVWQRKENVYRQIEAARLHIVTPSRWLANEAKNSALLRKFLVTVIPNGLNIEDFAPRDRCVARDVLKIPQDANVVLFIGASLGVSRKGFALLANALGGLSNLTNLFLIFLGSGKLSFDIQISHMHLGYIDNDRWLSLVYSAANLFVIPSLQDNLPNTVLESMACGTPIVGFDVGGISDMVRSGETGLLVPPQDVDELRNTIVELLQDPVKRARMAASCRRIAIEEYSIKVQAERYITLYEKILANR